MSAQTVRSFGLSLVLHCVAIMVVACFFTMGRPNVPLSFERPFVMVLSGDQDTSTRPSLGDAPRAIQFTMPAPKSRAPSTPTPAIEHTEPAPSSVRPAVRPRPKSTGAGVPRNNGASATPANSTLPKIPRVSESFPFDSRSPEAIATASEGDAGFGAALLADLRGAFVGSGIPGVGLTAVVAFSLAPDGRLVNPQILRSSGTPEFDAAVLDALRRVRARGFPQRAAGERYEVVFRANDE